MKPKDFWLIMSLIFATGSMIVLAMVIMTSCR